LLSAFALPREMLHTLTVPNATAANRGYVDGVSVQAVSQTPIYDGPVQEVSRAPSLSAEWCEAHPRNYGCVTNLNGAFHMLQVFGWVTLDESYGFQDKYRGILFPDYVSCRGVGYMTCGRCNGGALPPLSGIGSASWCQSSTPCAPRHGAFYFDTSFTGNEAGEGYGPTTWFTDDLSIEPLYRGAMFPTFERCETTRNRICGLQCAASPPPPSPPPPPPPPPPSLGCDVDEYRCGDCGPSDAYVLHDGTNCAQQPEKPECAPQFGCAGQQWKRCRGKCDVIGALELQCNQDDWRCGQCGPSNAYKIRDGTNCAQEPFKPECATQSGCVNGQWKRCRGYCGAIRQPS